MYRKPVLFVGLIAIIILGLLSACAPAAQSASAPASVTPPAAASSITPTLPAGAATSTPAPANTPAAAASATNRINLNTASAADFLTIPGVGSNMVKEFMEYRPYASIAVFEKQIGKYVSADQVKQYEQYVYVPVSANSSDAASLQQISGLDAAAASALIAARPYASNDAFLTALANVVSAPALAEARNLLSAQ